MTERPPLSGKICLVTGASAGIGQEIARGLAAAGGKVVLAVRNVQRGELARDNIVRSTGKSAVTVMQVDVALQSSIRAFAAEFKRTHSKLHLLVNNAAGWQTTRSTTAEGIELTWATNVLGPYLMTELLLDLLEAGAPSRVVNVASSVAGSLDLSDAQFESRKYDGFKAYMASKQALRMLTWGLAKRVEPRRVTANAVNPGFVRTELNRNAGGLMGTVIPLFARLMAKTPEQGADTPIWAAISPELEGVTGRFFSDRKEHACEFNEPAAIQQVEALCQQMTSGAGGTSTPRSTGSA